MHSYQLIDNEQDLIASCNQLASADWLALDTEFERINTYYPRLCLVQLSTVEQTTIIDALAISDLQPLFELLFQETIIKVLHSAHQDLEIFFNLAGKIPGPLYDTQLAAPLYGYDKGIGYGNLIKAALNVDLDKAHARTDWTRRPLTDDQLRYAADDVIYLGKVYLLFMEKAAEVDVARLKESFAVLYKEDTYRPDPDRMWKKIFAVRRLKGKPLAIAKKLAAWRELAARKQNLPRKWLLADQALVDIARQRPATVEELAQIDKVSEKMAKRYGKEWFEILAEYG